MQGRNAMAADTLYIPPETDSRQEELLEQDLSRIHLTEKPDNKYKFRRSIGAGGMKMVLQVYDQDTMRDVALAMMPDIERRSKHEILHFIQEARLTASLEHPNIVPVYDIGMDSTGSPYYTMKLLHGETLASLLGKMDAGDEACIKKYSFDKLLRLFLRICSGVGFAHSKNVAHLDLKPENIQIGDFSEVLILDWGIAKFLDETGISASASEKTGKKKQGFSRFSVSEDEGRKGSPGYMAPEQILGKSSSVGVRTDVYALGAILYSMVTYKSPASASTVKKILQDTVRGNIIPPSKRVPDREIPFGIEAVILKAMDPDPARRYGSAQELRDEVSAFIDGFATKAEKAGFFKKSLLLMRRHFLITISALFTLLMFLGIAVYLAVEIPRWHSDWIPIARHDFRKAPPDLSRLQFLSPTLQKSTEKWEWVPGKGLCAREGEYLVLSRAAAGNTKLVLTFEFPAITDTLEILLNADLSKPLADWWRSPDSYSFRIAESEGEKDCIVKNNSKRRFQQETIGSAESRTVPHSVITVTAERVDDVLTLKVNGHDHIRTTDYFPLTGKAFNSIVIRSLSGNLTIRKAELYRLARPENTTPLIAGDTLVELQLYDMAIEKYLSIAEDYGKSALAEKALLKAYITAASRISNRKKRLDHLLAVKRAISAKFPNYRYLRETLEMDAWVLWRAGRHKEALLLAGQVLRMNPESRVMSDIISLHHAPIDPAVTGEFFALLRQSRNLTSLDLSGYGLTSIRELAGMRLTFLDCSGNDLENLSGIENMPLNVLVCRNNRLENLSAAAGLPLKSLSCDNNNISDLAPLAGSPLTLLDCSDNAIKDLAPLAGLPLERLVCRGTRIAELSPLAGLWRLKVLDAGKNPIRDAAPLAGLPLERLRLDFTPIKDVSALSALPLHFLALNDCPQLRDLSPLRRMGTLQYLTIPKEAAERKENQEALRRLAHLKLLSTEAPLAGLRPLTEKPEEGANASSSPAGQTEKKKEEAFPLSGAKRSGGLEKIPEGVFRQP
ncbi:MAG: protein kinase [Lentisphaeria bacterium]|nr:protein kinase [Lentisphaeria bacterium]